MKTKIIIFCIFFISSLLSAQALSPEEKQAVIDSLNTDNLGICAWAINRVIDYKITEAIPIIEEKIWEKHRLGFKMEFIRAIAVLDTINITSFAHTIIDSAGIYYRNYPSVFYDSLLIRAEVSYYLVQKNDFSTVQYVFEIFDTTKWKHGFNTAPMASLKEIALRSPQYADSAKLLLRRFAVDTTLSSLTRWSARTDYEELNTSDVIGVLVTSAFSDPDWGNRWTSIIHLLERNYSGSRELLIDRLQNDIEPKNRRTISAVLTGFDREERYKVQFAKPQDYKAVAEQSYREPDSTTKDFILSILDQFRPLNQTESNTLTLLLDSLTSLDHQISLYNWLGNQSFVNELDSNLTSARGYIVIGDSINCARQIKLFQQKVNEEYKDSLDGDNKFVTIEGWKFLYYNAQYILERLPNEQLWREGK
jgi:hypothetical protein